MATLRILLLGTPAIYLDEEPVQIQRRIQRTLLFYLASRGDPVSRGELIDLFYPAESEEDARRHLREALSKLRADLPDPGVLIAGQDRVGLDLQKVYVDALEFRQLVSQVGRTPWQFPPATPIPAAVYQTLYKAIRLWRTPRFLAGVNLPSTEGLDDWLSRTSQDLEDLRGQILQRLADHATAAGDLEAALNWLRSAIECDEFNENLQYRILNILANLGRRSEAIKYYATLQNLFRSELGMSPPASIQTLFQKIQKESSVRLPTDRPGWPVSLSMQVPFVGRQRALNDLRIAFHRGGLVVVFGEAGAGKSRLIQELFLSIEPAPRLLLAPSHPLENSLPFQPIIELLRHSVRIEDWLNLSPVWVSQISVLLPELLIMRPEVPPLHQMAPEQARALLFEALRHLFTLLAQNQPLLVFLDDAQWADEATLATLFYLVERSFFNERGLLVIAARPEEPNPYLDSLLASSHTSTVFLQVNLEQLTEAEITDLTRYALGQTPSPEFVHRLAQDTGGNPLFLLETLRAILELSLGPDLSKAPETLPLASSIHALVRGRLRSLNSQARQALITAAIVGNEFNPLVIEKAGRMDADQVVQALDELERARLIRPSRTASTAAEPLYYFIHDKIREVLELELSPARNRLYHLRVAEALEQTLGAQAAQQASVLARHYEAGGNIQSAYQYWIQAGQRARQLFSLAEAYAAFRRAENLLQHLGNNLPDPLLYSLYASWGELAFEVNDQETVSRTYTTLLHLGEQRQSLLVIGTALSGLGSLAMARERFSEGLLYLDQALPYLERSADHFEHIQGHLRRGSLLRQLNRFDEALSAFQKVLDLCGTEQEPGIQRVLSNAHYQMALVFSHTGWPQKGAQHAEQALQLSAWTAHPLSEIRAYTVLSLSYLHTGKIDLALVYSQKGIELAEQTQSWQDAGRLHVYAARTALTLGNLDQYWDHLQAAFSYGERANSQSILSEAYCVKGDLFWLTDDFAQAIEIYQKGMTGAPGSYEALNILHRLGLVIGLNGRLDLGMTFIEEALSFTGSANIGLLNLAAELSQASLLAIGGQKEKAMQLARIVEEESRQRGFSSLPWMAALLRGMILFRSGETEAAEKIFLAVTEWAHEAHYAWLEIRGMKMLLQAQSQPGQDQRMDELFDSLENRTTVDAICAILQKYRQNMYRQWP